MTRHLHALVLAGCATTTYQGSVFVDRNGDHVRQADEPGLPGVVVAVDRGGFVMTGAGGQFTIALPDPGEIVWVRTPAGFRPGPVWSAAQVDTDLELGVVPLTPAEQASPLTFVVAADSHMPADPSAAWDGGDLATALAQATDLPEPPRFVTIVGDISQDASPAAYARVGEALGSLDVPFVPVPGNHDWFDGGTAYRAQFGPDNYSFDVDGVHVVVWDTNASAEAQVGFFAADLASVGDDTPVVALGHMSPPDEVADQLAALGVDYVFTGHWHANRRVPRRGLVEWGTQTFIMGGIDQSPAGYRIVTFDGATPTVVERERLLEPHVELVSPHPGSCAAPYTPIVAAVAQGAGEPVVTARIDCGDELPLAPAGGWTFAVPDGALATLAPGPHSVELRATSHGASIARRFGFEACAPAGAPTSASWPQLGGGPTHAGATTPIAPPLQVAWATPVGAPALLGSPVVAGDVALVATTDLAAGDTGGVVALDLATGRIRWRHPTPFPANGAPAIAGDVAIVTLGDGELLALALADGRERWHANVSDGLPSLASSLWAPPVVDGDTVFAGVQFRFAAFDVATGEPRWTHALSNTYPWLGSRAAPAIADGFALATFSRSDGLAAYDARTGDVAWHFPAVAIQAAPVIADGVAYVADATGDVTALDVATGTRRWTRELTPGGFDWGYSITATPALANGTLFVATQWDDLVALDARTGGEKWRYRTPRGPLSLAHYRSAQAGFAGSPLVAGDTVWIGRPDGRLAALSAIDGHELWATNLGAPIVSAPAPTGNGLIVAGYDGVVRALVQGSPTAAIDPPVCPPVIGADGMGEPTTGGCCSASGGGGSLLLAIVVGLVLRRGRTTDAMSERLARMPRMEPTFETILEDARAGVRVQLARQTIEPDRVACGDRLAAVYTGGDVRACRVTHDQAQTLRLLGAVDVLRATRDA